MEGSDATDEQRAEGYLRNTSDIKVKLDSKASRFNVKKRELDENISKSKMFERTVIVYLAAFYSVALPVQENQQRYQAADRDPRQKPRLREAENDGAQ